MIQPFTCFNWPMDGRTLPPTILYLLQNGGVSGAPWSPLIVEPQDFQKTSRGVYYHDNSDGMDFNLVITEDHVLSEAGAHSSRLEFTDEESKNRVRTWLTRFHGYCPTISAPKASDLELAMAFASLGDRRQAALQWTTTAQKLTPLCIGKEDVTECALRILSEHIKSLQPQTPTT